MKIGKIIKLSPILLLLMASISIAACGEKSNSSTTKSPSNNSSPTSDAKTISGTVPITAPIIDPIIDPKVPGVWHRSSRPRVLLDKERLELTINRMYGSSAREPYSRWFNLIKQSEDNGVPVDLVNLALIYQATGDPVYKNNFLARMPKSGVPNLTELYAIDIMFEDLALDAKQSIMDRVASSPTPWYYDSIKQSTGTTQAKWGYHDAIRVAPAFAYAAIFADTELEKNKDAALFPFNAKNYLNVVDEQLSDNGYFTKIENRIAGEPTYNSALPGSKGGVYDNIGYDTSEESYSINLLLQHHVLTGETRYTTALHDKYRASFFQNMSVPHRSKKYDRNGSCRKAGTKSYTMAQIWNTQTSDVTQPSKNGTAVAAFLYQDSKMQHYVTNGIQKEFCWQPYNGMFWELIYFDDQLSSSPPKENPTAMYFSGPGIVTMRSSWNDDASFGVFMAGEGISRRYEDANSFLISRKTEVIPHAGARIRFNADNMKHFWYHIRSASKNTLKIFDPDESFDINADGTTGELHSGRKLVDSDNLGGQIFEISPSNKDKCYNTYAQCSTGQQRKGDAFPLDIYETANIIKFEHVENDYTYTVGDASAAYTKKIDYFEREFLLIRPDTFVIFDRVKSTKPEFRKVWTIHTVDQPIVNSPSESESMGVSQHRNAQYSRIEHPENNTHIYTLLPKNNITTVRGGDTTLILEETLKDIQPVTLDIPRWLEVFVLGSDVKGSLTISGETLTEANAQEVVEFNGKNQTYVTNRPTLITDSNLYDETAVWKEDQWAGYQLTYRYNQTSFTTIIKANSRNRLFGQFIPASSYKYSIERPIANTYKHWKKINSITTTDMNINEIRVSVPHYFDTTDAKGRLHSFAPHTDYKDDNYQKRPDLGQWTMEVEATEPNLLDNFAHVIDLKDPSKPSYSPKIFENKKTYAIALEKETVLFSKEKPPLSKISFNADIATKQTFVTNLIPETDYYLTLSNSADVFTLATSPKEGKLIRSSAMGIAKFHASPYSSTKE